MTHALSGLLLSLVVVRCAVHSAVCAAAGVPSVFMPVHTFPPCQRVARDLSIPSVPRLSSPLPSPRMFRLINKVRVGPRTRLHARVAGKTGPASLTTGADFSPSVPLARRCAVCPPCSAPVSAACMWLQQDKQRPRLEDKQQRTHARTAPPRQTAAARIRRRTGEGTDSRCGSEQRD